jgi:hypothetical protein
VEAFNMEARTGDISGSGNADMLATELLKVNTSGSGDVFYKGSPTLDINISGSGEVFDAN